MRARGDDRLRIRAEKSLIAQAWLGDSLAGTFSASDCRLVQVWNGSHALLATAARSAVSGCVGVDDAGHCVPIGEAPGFVPLGHIDRGGELRPAVARMDYRID